MLELMLCSMLTIFPDYLYRRYVQGKKFGREITLYSVWYELRYGIAACLVLTVSLITAIFYFHPSTTNAVSFFRTVPILPEGSGRVEEVYADIREKVKAGQPLFKLDSSEQEAAAETARRRIAEADAALEVARSQLAVSDAQIQEAQSSYQQAVDELDTKVKLQAANASTVAEREVEKLRNLVAGREAALAATVASKQLIEIAFEKELIPKFWTAHFSALRSSLESGVPTGRNKLGGHGQGPEVVEVPPHIVSYVLHQTASAIVFLVEAEKSMP